MCWSIAAMRSPSMAMSTGGGASPTRAVFVGRALELPPPRLVVAPPQRRAVVPDARVLDEQVHRSPLSLPSCCPPAASAEHGAALSTCHWQPVTDGARVDWHTVPMTAARGGRTVRPHACPVPHSSRFLL